MDQNPKKEEPKEDLELDQKQKEELEDLEELKEVIKKLEELHKNQPPKRPRRKMIALEFGGVFHHNRYFNFVFTYILTFVIGFFILELFPFAEYDHILYYAAMILLFTTIEEISKIAIYLKFFAYIIRTFGLIFYFVYLLIFFVIDQYILIDSFNFLNELALPLFVLMLAGTRYFAGQMIRNYLRYRNVR